MNIQSSELPLDLEPDHRKSLVDNNLALANKLGTVRISIVDRMRMWNSQQAKTAGAWRCRLGGRNLDVSRFVPDLEIGKKAVIMARPESLRLVEKGSGFADGRVRMNVYLGHSIETFVETAYGEVLIQVDDPASKKIFVEGTEVSIDFVPERVRLLKDE
jgi:ABC-type Fe3+/spermidine/putrescine transport system ATPase subunit